MTYELKTKLNDLNVRDYVNAISDEKQHEDVKKLVQIFQKATGAKPKMWGTSIVGFGSYHYKYASGQEGDWMIVGLSARKQATVLYGIMNKDVSESEFAKLGKFKVGKGCLYIKKLSDIDSELLLKYIKSAFKQPKI